MKIIEKLRQLEMVFTKFKFKLATIIEFCSQQINTIEDEFLFNF